MQAIDLEIPTVGYWTPGASPPEADSKAFGEALRRVNEPFCLLRSIEGFAVGRGGTATLDESGNIPQGSYTMAAYVPACPLRELGDASFCEDLGIRFPYVGGAMANGVCSVEMVEAFSHAGMIGFFGSAGLPLPVVEAAIDRLESSLGTAASGGLPYGVNLIHSPNEPRMEAGAVDLFLERGIRLVSASAYLRLSLPLVRYRVHGIHRNADGRIVAPNHVVGKVSRIEVAKRFFSPPPDKMLAQLVESGDITAEQAEMAKQIPIAQDITAEADSGGHTDNQPFLALLPTMLALRDEMQATFGYDRPLRVGAAGGIGTPVAAAAAFTMGAAYVLTGSINQACVEAGTSAKVREMLCNTRQSDVAMAPAADMFEMGVEVQVLKRGTMFAMRGKKLYQAYRDYEGIHEFPPELKAQLEKDLFHAPLEEIWAQTAAYFEERDPSQVARAEGNPKYQMALLFRWYLGQASNWAIQGIPERMVDYQIWCGPAMGSFNEWVKGSDLEPIEARNVESIALNLLLGAAVLTRVHGLRSQGICLAPADSGFLPMGAEQIKELLN